MCRPDDDIPHDNMKQVVISGAGPAGLLLAALLLQRNDELPAPLFDVTLIDNRADLGGLTEAELKKTHRSWMLGLAGHGVQALKTVDDQKMWKTYCQHVGIQLDSLSIHLGTKELVSTNTTADEEFPDNFIVDRNFIVASLARYLREEHSDNDHLTLLYEHHLQYVDYEQKRVLVRNIHSKSGTEESYMPYDLLVGCDGCRSVVREAMVKRHATFEVQVNDIFQSFKAVHVERPLTVKPSSMHLLPDIFPNMQGIALPETGNMLNISIGTPRHLFENGLAQELKSDNPQVVAQYFRDNFKAFELQDYDDLAQQWVNQRWNRTAQVHCNFYHSNEAGVVLMGDAAHATSPSIGMGMNQALKDAQTFYYLLQAHHDKLDNVLPAFSEARVKEGNALSDLAMHLFCMDTKVQLVETLHMVIRSKLHTWFPSLVENHPQAIIGLTKYGLSDVYDLAMKLGIIQKHRAINDRIRQSYFESQTGMVKKDHNPTSKWKPMAIAGAVAFAGVAYHKFA